MKKRFSFKSRYQSLGHAFAGLRKAWHTEHNVRVHAVATIAVIIAGIGFHVSSADFAILCLAIGLVWMAELFNTAIERMADYISPEKQQAIGIIKDIAAAAVLVAAFAAVVVACFIFIPKC